MISALNGPLDATTQDVLNRKLERINGAAQSSTLELLDRTGLAVAASNWTCRAVTSGTTTPSARISTRPEPGHRALLCGGRDQRVPGYFFPAQWWMNTSSSSAPWWSSWSSPN
jgi:two-component system C4-dicarboxylate transport sensor histidine kinase DctB